MIGALSFMATKPENTEGGIAAQLLRDVAHSVPAKVLGAGSVCQSWINHLLMLPVAPSDVSARVLPLLREVWMPHHEPEDPHAMVRAWSSFVAAQELCYRSATLEPATNMYVDAYRWKMSRVLSPVLSAEDTQQRVRLLAVADAAESALHILGSDRAVCRLRPTLPASRVAERQDLAAKQNL